MQHGLVMRRHLDIRHAGHGGDLAPFGDSGVGVAIELHHVDGPGFHEPPRAPARQLVLAGGERNARVHLELFERSNVVVPVQRLFEPGDVQIVQQVGRADGGGDVPALVDVEHQLDFGTEGLKAL